MSKIKNFIKDIPNNVWVYILIAVVGAIAVIYFCGIKGNNQENFYYKGDAVCEDSNGKPRPPFYPKETPPIKKGVNINKGTIVIKTA